MIRYKCLRCGAVLEISDGTVGGSEPCPNCGLVQAVPKGGPEEQPAYLRKIAVATRRIVGVIVFVVGGVVVTRMPEHMSSVWLSVFVVFLGFCISGVGVDIWKGGWPFGQWKDVEGRR
jgi:DNA-directed RNA polymerase subunit RPC12/RpoP